MSIDSLADLLEISVGFQKSQTLFTFVELEITYLLKNKPLNADAIASHLEIHPLAMERFLDACVSIGILKKTEGLYENADIAEKFLLKDNEFYLGGQLKRSQNRSLPQWLNLTKHLKSWNYGEKSKQTPDKEDQGAEAMAEQHNLALLHGYTLAEQFNFSNYKMLLDLGGGTGATSIGLCKNYPHLKSIIFDLPENIEIAEKFIKKSGVKNQIKIVGGDIKNDEVPDNFDIAILANFMAVADAETNKELLKTLYNKLPPGGACILSGWIIDDSHLAPQISVLFCLEDICWNAPDVERSEKVYTQWLEEAGFVDVVCQTYLEPTKMLYGFKD